MITFIARHTHKHYQYNSGVFDQNSSRIVIYHGLDLTSEQRVTALSVLNRVSDNDDVILRVIFPGAGLTDSANDCNPHPCLSCSCYQNCCGKRHVWRGVGVINRQLLSVSYVHQTLKLILDYDKRISASFVSLNPLNTLDCHYIVKISVQFADKG